MSGPGFHIFTFSSGATFNLAFTTINQHILRNCWMSFHLYVIQSLWLWCGTCKQLLHSMLKSPLNLVDSNLNIYFNKDNLTTL